MTVVEILLSLRQQLLKAHAENDEDELIKLQTVLDRLQIIAEQIDDPKAIGLLDDMLYAVNHLIMQVDFKGLPAIPTPEAIRQLEDR
jgi:hypothetical protein